MDSSLSRRALLNSENSIHSSYRKEKAEMASAEDVGEINTFLAMLDAKPTLKRTSNDQQTKNTTILSRSQAEVTMKRLAGSVYHGLGPGQSPGSSTEGSSSAPGPHRLWRQHTSTLSSGSGGGKPGSVLQGLLEEDESKPSLTSSSSSSSVNQSPDPQQFQSRMVFHHQSQKPVGSTSSPLSASPGSYLPSSRYVSSRTGRSRELSGGSGSDHHHHLDRLDDGEVVGKLELSFGPLEERQESALLDPTPSTTIPPAA